MARQKLVAIRAMVTDKPAPVPLPAQVSRPRLDSVDALRGLVMVIMALDHVRDFFTNVAFYPMDLSQTTVPLFFTRFITHYCAPVFTFLAGTGAYLASRRGKSKPELCWFLMSRGLWLAFLEVTWVNCMGWLFNFTYTFVGIGVLWSIGWSMVALSLLIFLPIRVVTVFGIVMVLTHNLLDGVDGSFLGSFSWLWTVLHKPGQLHPTPNLTVGIGYVLIPWMGVMAAGYGFGTFFSMEPERRQRLMRWIGLGMIALFLVLRATNIYGDPTPWTTQKNLLFTAMGWVHVLKYPPSLDYILITIGPALLVLASFDKSLPKWMNFTLVFGRVPLFYYLLHLPLIHGLAVLIFKIRDGNADWLFVNPPGNDPAPHGFGLPVVYLIWILLIVGLYPVCKWFMELKRRRKDAWLSYL